jgi:cysteine desulfurase
VRLSRETRYAVLALAELAGHPDGEIVEARALARAARRPAPFLQKILAMLASAGVLDSYRGRGYRLARPASDVRLVEVLGAVKDDAFGDQRCIFWREECSADDPCPLHFRWRELRPAMEAGLGQITLDEIRRRGAEALIGD